MKTKLAALALSATMAVCGLAGMTLALGLAGAEGAEDANEKVIAAMTGNDKGYVSETEWATAYAHQLTGTDTCSGTVKLATVGTNLFFRMVVKDTTKFTGKDRLAFKITVGEKSQDLQGNYAPWLTGTKAFGENIQTEISYDEASTSYVVTIGIPLGDSYILGAAADVSFTHNDALTADTEWGKGAAITYADTLYLGQMPSSGSDSSDSGSSAGGGDSSVDSSESADSSGQDENSSGSSSETEAPAPENPDLKIVVTDIPSKPTESDWAKATAYELVANNSTISDGATGTLKVYTAAKNIFFRLEVNDPTTNTQNDRLYVYLGTEACHIETRGNYKKWLNAKRNDFSTPALFEQSTTATEQEGWKPGVYTFDYGFYIPDIYGEGNTIRLCVKHCDSRSDAETWVDNDYAHTIYFDQVLTFGSLADTTVRPQEPTENFIGSAVDISYNKAAIEWTEQTGADTYMLYVYTVNPEGSVEPYKHVSIEGPVYSGDAEYKETLYGLSATTDYAVQIVAYDSAGEIVAHSSLVLFKTISRQEALDSSASSSDTTFDSSASSSDKNSDSSANASDASVSSSGSTAQAGGGCGSALGLGAASVLAVAGALVIGLKRRKE